MPRRSITTSTGVRRSARGYTVPVLALNGSLDVQTEPNANLAAWRKRLTGTRDLTVMELRGLNHMFQHARTGWRGQYRDIEEPSLRKRSP